LSPINPSSKELSWGREFPALPGRSVSPAELHTSDRPGEEKYKTMAQLGKGNNHQHEFAKKHMQQYNGLIVKILMISQITGYKRSQGHR
jgi:hypothetical protein